MSIKLVKQYSVTIDWSQDPRSPWDVRARVSADVRARERHVMKRVPRKDRLQARLSMRKLVGDPRRHGKPLLALSRQAFNMAVQDLSDRIDADALKAVYNDVRP